jgi:hypothetical protein
MHCRCYTVRAALLQAADAIINDLVFVISAWLVYVMASLGPAGWCSISTLGAAGTCALFCCSVYALLVFVCLILVVEGVSVHLGAERSWVLQAFWQGVHVQFEPT